ncbi:uncharacterized protein DUF2726 [Bisgaardia hudsonensis]|uniref:Uncharacterized protein DUF2726 n=1 Tax=Bisgaardia hudsonensis TaxID=109472 RepID=A0A4R2N0I9_9PAST|nr:DUF2726 domain-containing protein [Bisgaardia hudsonensis]TCP12901.1 uncharacterized protein DUF2726 [Bisgaardia hudsonensis]
MNADFQKAPLMNKCEYKLYIRLIKLLNEQYYNKGLRLFSQVSMGEFLKSKDSEAFKLINSKRVDFLIINNIGLPVVVIEYQGNGHFDNNFIERDAIKREVCRKVGIEFIEIKPEYDELEFDFIARALNSVISKNVV